MLLLVVFFFVLNALRLVHAVSGTSLTTLLNQLDDTSKCNSQIISSSLHIILQQYLQREKPNLLLLAKIITQSSRPYSVQLPKNANFVNKSPVTMNSTEPLYILQLYCNQHRQQRHTAAIWHPILIYPLETHNSFLVIKLPNIDLYACTSSNCTNSKVIINFCD
ncbi:unnamed protein product [Dracunculus medinensis]|uniref:Secreted protein n=1 Tax=Dracunculus medinensis TaxID=318479 RepID=A0A0N4UG65_DRAME|nr:unnamed protein product [Dracunculus medinensis]